jgi:hypothetical protein
MANNGIVARLLVLKLFNGSSCKPAAWFSEQRNEMKAPQ